MMTAPTLAAIVAIGAMLAPGILAIWLVATAQTRWRRPLSLALVGCAAVAVHAIQRASNIGLVGAVAGAVVIGLIAVAVDRPRSVEVPSCRASPRRR